MGEIRFVKKIKLFPLGDENEVDRVYKYLRDAMFKQYQTLNIYMSQLATLYYKCGKDISSPEYNEGKNAICRVSENPFDFEQPKGLGMFSNASNRVKKDLKTAHNNGLWRGESQVPYYKKTYPILSPNRFLNFYTFEENDKTIYAIKWVNGINFKVVLGSRGKRDYYLIDILEKLTNANSCYTVCDSSISLDGKEIILNLTLKKDVDDDYEPIKGKVMGVSLGYNIPIKCVFSDSDKEYSVGNSEKFITKRQDMQNHYRRLQKELKSKPGGHGRNKKLANLDKYKKQEKNYVKGYNHILSKQIVKIAEENKVECIVIENITKEILEKHPTLLRNWSYFELVNFVNYKAERIGIKVLLGKDIKTNICYKCGEELDTDVNIRMSEETEWSRKITCICPKCNNVCEYDSNKAKILSYNKATIEEIEKKSKKNNKKKKVEESAITEGNN